MSDFMPGNIIDELWNEILKLHWIFLETEECKAKLETRKKLEDCLKEFLGIVPHHRKFFLPETANVLKQSIRDLEDFSAQKAIIAFDSISQYANNLFTKPWRKEFRIVKMYSGFYHHEIKSNLLNAESLFEAMGYRRLSEDTLILDGPICPDQVTNVSRDAMTAYVELQIIKHIYTTLDAVGLNFSWLDIYRHREKYDGGSSQAIKTLAYSVEEKRFRSRQKALLGDNYGYIDVQPSSNYFATNPRFCPDHCQCKDFQQLPPLPRHRPIAQPNDICCAPEHHQQSPRTTNSNYGNMSYPAHFQHSHHHRHNTGMSNDSEAVPLHQMSHSRSLDHYSEPVNRTQNILPQRHSFDHQQQGCTAHQYHNLHNLQHQHPQQQQQQHYYQHPNQPQQNCYENPYDCIDGHSLGGGSSTISYAAVSGANTAITGPSNGGVGFNFNLNSSSTYSHPYNFAGNRIPLPINQFSVYDNLQSTNYSGPQEPTCTPILDQHMYTSASKLQQNCLINTNVTGHHNQSSNIHGLQNPLLMKDSLQSQRSCQTEQLISFEDPSIISLTTPQQLQQQQDPLNQYHQSYETSNRIMDKHYNMRNAMENSLPATSTSPCQQHCVSGKHLTTDNMHVYAKPTPRENRKQNVYTYSSGERGDTTDMSYDSANDRPCQENERYHLVSPTPSTKNVDGNGSLEYWKNVSKNYQTNGSSKDLGENKDLLVQSLNLDSLNINKDTSTSQNSSAEKKICNYSGNENRSVTQLQQLEPNQKTKTFESDKYLLKNNAKIDKSVCITSSSNNTQKPKTSMDCNTKKIKPALKQTNKTSKLTTNTNPNQHPNKTKPKTNDNKIFPKTLNNNNTECTTNPDNRAATQRKKSQSSAVTTANKSSPIDSTNASPHSKQIIVTSAIEWSCKFCTFLNLENERICEICSKTKDFIPDSSEASTTSTGRTNVAQNTPTCA